MTAAESRSVYLDLSTPSLGITGQCGNMLMSMGTGLSTPSLGITDSKTTGSLGPVLLRPFQLPLSGSLVRVISIVATVAGLSTPSLGITKYVISPRHVGVAKTFNSLSRDH